jgi:hypothetical protein
MRWTPGDRSNVEDYRGRSGFGVGRGVPIGIGGLLVLFLLSWATGINLCRGLAPGVPGASGIQFFEYVYNAERYRVAPYAYAFPEGVT